MKMTLKELKEELRDEIRDLKDVLKRLDGEWETISDGKYSQSGRFEIKRDAEYQLTYAKRFLKMLCQVKRLR